MRLVSRIVVAFCLGFSGVASLPAAALQPEVIDKIGDSSFEALDLEWMRWDITSGMSINSALDVYGSSGWRLASNTELVDLLLGINVSNYDQADPLIFDYDENTSLSHWDPASHGGFGWAEELFGFTTDFSDSCDLDSYEGCPYHISALFGEDGDNDGLYNLFDFSYMAWSDNSYTNIELTADLYDADYTTDADPGWWGYTHTSGVALVRNVTPMPWPSSLTMFLAGFSFLLFLKHRRRLLGRFLTPKQ